MSRSDQSFESQPHTRAKGALAEASAVRWLRAQGYSIIATNVVTLAGEIDVIALDEDTLCFIEIKARATQHQGHAIEAVDRRKQRRLVRCAALYLGDEVEERPCRFDVLGLDREGETWRFTLLRNAFEAV